MTSQQSKIAVFDLDGTLIETDAANSAAYHAAMQKYGVDVFGVYGRVTASVIRQILCDNGKNDVDAIIDEKVAAYCHELWRTRLGPAAGANIIVAGSAVFGSNIEQNVRELQEKISSYSKKAE